MGVARRSAPVLFAAALATRGAAPEPPHRLPGVETSRVVLEARVTDTRARSLPGLRPSDFRLEVDGRKVPVESAVWIEEGGDGADRPSPGLSRGTEPSESALPGRADSSGARLLVLLFQKDFEGSRLRGLLRAIGQAKELLAPLTPRDRVAVLTFDSHLRLHLDFTPDLEAVTRILDESVLQRWPGRVEP